MKLKTNQQKKSLKKKITSKSPKNVYLKKDKIKSKKQKGGEFIGVGSFGCVVNPIIKCKKKIKDDKYVSKLSTYRSFDIDELESIYDEINIGKKIIKIDKGLKYLSPIIDYCVFKIKDNKKRTDLKINKLSDEDSLDDEIELLLVTKNVKKKQCIINLNEHIIIINLILPHSGLDLDTIFKQKQQFNEQLKILKYNIKPSIYYLIKGLQLLHKHSITHKDIKPHNICLSILNNKPILKYIDFGLSENITTLNKSYRNILNSGTPCYMAPDFIVLVEMKRQNFSELLLNNKLNNYLIKKIYQSIKSNLSTFTDKGLNKSYLNGNYDNYLGKSSFNSELLNKKNYFITEQEIKNIYMFLLNLYKQNDLLDYYFLKVDGINPKFDIFSLGLTLFEVKNELEIKDILLTNLLKKMLELNSINRININECLDRLYFK